MITIHDLVAAGRQTLQRAGIPPDEADLDARLLAQALLGWDAARFFTSAGDSARAAFTAAYGDLIARRAAREPLAYITGRQEFWNLSFEVSPAVLVPRPETELIVETALELFPDPADSVKIADVGTGSGCLAVALACERSRARVVATDLSAGALEVARQNAHRHGVDRRVQFIRTDLLSGIASAFDLLVSNPPYVPVGDRVTLQPEVRDYEPAAALFAGADGLTFIRRLVADSPAHLRPGGALVFEFGFGQDAAVEQVIADAPELRLLGLRRDLQGIPRTAIARRAADRALKDSPQSPGSSMV